MNKELIVEFYNRVNWWFDNLMEVILFLYLFLFVACIAFIIDPKGTIKDLRDLLRGEYDGNPRFAQDSPNDE